MEPTEIVKKSIEISNTFDSIATRIFERAKTLRKEQELSYEEYKQIMDNYYLPLMNYSSKILMDTSNLIIDDIDQYMKDLESSSGKLKEISKKLDDGLDAKLQAT
ncbi:hypothetical protein LCGC14_3027860 [marine sediment metagenome]|uniref:Uncharacterized protein n=1 Tax=marine sediment metagenome TaxID=412755 RepID=A0A0F8XGG3_9ZZZZ